MHDDTTHIQNTIVDLLDEAYDGRLEHARIYLKEYCPDYVRACKASTLLGEELDETISQDTRLPFKKFYATKLKLLKFSGWHCYLSGRIAALVGIRNGVFVDPDTSTKNELFGLKRLNIGMEYGCYQSQLSEYEEQYLKAVPDEQKILFRQFSNSLDTVYGHIWDMMYLMGFDSLLESPDLAPSDRRLLLQNSDKLRECFAIE